jgi:hypothetical protein
MHDVISYVFWQRSAILTESAWKQEHKASTLIQVLIAQTVIFKTLKCWNSRIQKVDNYKPTLL